MRRGAVALLGAATLGAVFAAPAAAGGAPKEMELESSAFEPGAEIPLEFACSPDSAESQQVQAPFEGGQNISPPLEWSKPPKGTKELALLMDDVDVFNPENPEERFVHWGVWRLKPKSRELEQGTLPDGARQIMGGYFGPCPPETHTYEFKLYALKKKLKADDGAPVPEFQAALQSAIDDGRVLGQGVLQGVFTPPS